MEHLLERTGFEIKGLYGDFLRHGLQDDSSEMVWVATNGSTGEQLESWQMQSAMSDTSHIEE